MEDRDIDGSGQRELLRLARHGAAAMALAFASFAQPATAAAPDVLPPQQAFPYRVSAAADELRLDFAVRPGYYLYRERFAFDSTTEGIELGTAAFPAGEIHSDEFFGEQEIYRGEFRIVIPYAARAGLQRLELGVRLQGCADIGLCYPPQRWPTEVALPDRAASAAAPREASPGAAQLTPAPDNALLALLGGRSAGEFLPPDEAFVFNADLADPFTLRTRWIIAEGYYLYRDQLRIEASGPGVVLGEPRLPDGKHKYDEYFGDSEVYYEELTVLTPLSRPAQAGTLELQIGYQGCAEDGICYPPISRSTSIVLPAASAAGARPGGPPGGGASGPVSEQDRLAALIRDGHLALVLAIFFGSGLLLAFTPCVLPMVPILSGIIAGQGASLTTARSFALSVCYVFGMASTYTAVGTAFAAAGQQAQAFFQQPWIIVPFAGLFVVLALAMFGAFELQLPAALQTRLSALSNRQRAGTFLGTAIMGALSALIVTACVAPPLVAALAVIGQSGDMLRGGLALASLSIGMGTPLLVVGASAGKLLPRAGPWMEQVKTLFGLLFLALSIWMLARLLPDRLTLGLWAALALFAGWRFGALRLLRGASAPIRLGRAAAAGILLYGVLLGVGAIAGGHDPLRPLHGTALMSSGGADRMLTFERIKSVDELQARLAEARTTGRPVMLDFYADWCVSCKEMEHYTFTDPRVHEALDGALLLQADVTANDATDQALLRHFGIYGPPTIAFFGPDGHELTGFRIVGYMPAERFAEHVRAATQATRVAR